MGARLRPARRQSRVRHEDAQPSVLPRHAAVARRRRPAERAFSWWCAGRRARARRRKADANHREPAPDRHSRAHRDSQRLEEIASAIAKANLATSPSLSWTHVSTPKLPDNKLKIASFVGSDNYEGGRLAGEHMAKSTGGKARVAILEGIRHARDRRLPPPWIPRGPQALR